VEIDNRTHVKDPELGRAIGMMEHGGGGVREGGPLAFHFGELIMSARAYEVGCVSQGRDHGAEGNIKVVVIIVELDGRPEGTSLVHASVQIPNHLENGR
jgi:hypothetical protein